MPRGGVETLPRRLTYVAYAEVTVPARQLSLQVQNFDFARAGVPEAATVKPPAPAAAPLSQAATVQKMKELKQLLSQGIITQAQYDTESQKLLNELLK